MNRAAQLPEKDVRIRAATVNDVAQILECLSSSFEFARDCYPPAAFAATVLDDPSLRQRMATHDVLVAVDPSGQIVGTVSFGIQSEGIGRIRGMAVLPRFHGSDAARMLLDAAMVSLRQKGCFEVRLGTTAPLSRAIAFYEKHGFARTGDVSDFLGIELIELASRLE